MHATRLDPQERLRLSSAYHKINESKMNGKLALRVFLLICCSVAAFPVLQSVEGTYIGAGRPAINLGAFHSLIDTAIASFTGRGQADDCTSGFMSLDRMNKVLDTYIVNAPYDQQAIIPEINFTCNGTIRTWIIGGQWRNNGENNIELQIWRSNRSGSYNRVRSTVVTVATSNATWVYHLPTNLSFQAGDILGFYLPSDSRFGLRLAVHMDYLQTVYLRNGNQDNEFATTANISIVMQNVLVSVETGKFLVYMTIISVP